jgi:hypothetical protein
MDISYGFLGLKREWPKHGSNKTAQLSYSIHGYALAIPVARRSNYFVGTAPSTPTGCPHRFIFLWGIAYRSNPGNLDELETNLSNITADISLMTFRALSTNAIRLVRLCMLHAGAYFHNCLQQYIF